MPPRRSNLRFRALAAALTILTALPGCSRPALPPYTRLEGASPTVEGLPAGAALVVFWATWCPPCREELPALCSLAKQPPLGVTVVTLGEDEPEETVRAFFRGAPPPELGYRRDFGRRAATAFGVDVLPTAILVKDGRLVARFAGPQDWNSSGMRRLLVRLVGEAPTSPPSSPSVDAARAPR